MKTRRVIAKPQKPLSRSQRAEERYVNKLRSSPFRFLDLPVEIRSSIYKLCLIDQEDIMMFHKFPNPEDAITLHRRLPWPMRALHPLQTSLLSVNTIVHDEASAILYGCNSFEFGDHADDRLWEIFIHFASLLTDVSRRSLRELYFWTGTTAPPHLAEVRMRQRSQTGQRLPPHLSSGMSRGSAHRRRPARPQIKCEESTTTPKMLEVILEPRDDLSEGRLKGICKLSDTTSLTISKYSYDQNTGCYKRPPVWISPKHIEKLRDLGWYLKVQ